MSKNLYRINKKSDLDEIMKNNFLKPIFIIFVSKSIDKKLYDDIATTLKAMSKQLTYGMILVIDFDDFIDNMNFFSSIKENVPYMLSYFKAKQIAVCNEKDNFIPIMVSSIEQIHTSYVNKLTTAFNQQNSQQTKTPELDDHDKQKEILIKEDIINNKQDKQDKQEDEVEQEIEEQEDEVEQDDEVEEQEVEEQEVVEVVEIVEEKKQTKEDKNTNKKKETDDNTTEEIRLKKEKLKEIKRLREMLNNAK
jgi:hypothetical protein